MNQEFTEDELRELEKQLSCPSGEFGIKIGIDMNESNMGMILNSIEFLELKNGNSILELGHGNCAHLGELLESAAGIKYFGLEISETMLKEAEKINSKKEAGFKLYDGKTVPYTHGYFDRVLSVNTIYFWTNPTRVVNEIERVLKLKGLCVLTYVNKDFAKKMPFVRDRFTLYDQADLAKLTEGSKLKIMETRELTDQVKSKTGVPLDRAYTITKIKKM